MVHTYLVEIGYFLGSPESSEYLEPASKNIANEFTARLIKTEHEGPWGLVVGKFWLQTNTKITSTTVQRLCFPNDNGRNPNSINEMIAGYGKILNVNELDDDASIGASPPDSPQSPEEYAGSAVPRKPILPSLSDAAQVILEEKIR